MEQSLFEFAFAFTFLMFMVSIFGKLENSLRALFAIISMVFFAGLSILSLNIEIITYDVNLGNYSIYRIAEHSNEYMLWMAICLIMFIFSFLRAFVAITYKPVMDASKGIDIPKGFQSFQGVFKKWNNF